LWRYKEAKVVLETSLSSLQHASLDKNKRTRFLRDVQESLQKVSKLICGKNQKWIIIMIAL